MTEPTSTDLINPVFNAIWEAIKHWDIETTEGQGYSHTTGTDVMVIMEAIKPFIK